jgi:hypothetical protein
VIEQELIQENHPEALFEGDAEVEKILILHNVNFSHMLMNLFTKYQLITKGKKF